MSWHEAPFLRTQHGAISRLDFWQTPPHKTFTLNTRLVAAVKDGICHGGKPIEKPKIQDQESMTFTSFPTVYMGPNSIATHEKVSSRSVDDVLQ